MKKILLVLFLFGSVAYSQQVEKYLVYFKDKGITKSNTLSKTTQEYQIALNQLSERSIERRKKVLGDDIITFEDIPVKSEYVQAVEKVGAEIVWELKWFNAVSCWISNEQKSQIENLPFVDRVEKVKIIKSDNKEITDKFLPKVNDNGIVNYNFDYGGSLTQDTLSDIPLVHDLGYNGQNVIVGLLDAGFAWKSHPATQNADVIAERDFVYGDGSTDDGDAGHGTAVFSIIGGFNEGEIIGPAFGAKFILAKTENIFSETHIEEDNYAAALEWMESLGVDITSSSLGYNVFDEGEESYEYKDMDGKTTIVTKACEIAFSKGVLTMTSAGNEGNKTWHYITAPADGFNTIAVGAVNSSNEVAGFSSRGPSYDKRIKPEIVTQGVSCYHATAYSEGYGYGSGTSFAAPIAAGMAAQLLSAYPYLKNTQMRRIILEAGDNPSKPNNDRGYGLLSIKRALEYPNLKEENGGYILNKMFIDEVIEDGDSVIVEIYKDGDDAIGIAKMEENNGYYSLQLPQYPNGTKLGVLFKVIKGGGGKIAIPDNAYKFIYGSLEIFKNTTDKVIPQNFKLYQNYPNPFNSITTIIVDLPDPANLDIKVYNILGQEIKTIFSGDRLQGQYRFFWNGTDNYGSRVSSGVYIYRVTTQSNTASQKMMYIQ